jgi:hypothetical protein
VFGKGKRLPVFSGITVGTEIKKPKNKKRNKNIKKSIHPMSVR